MPTYRQILAKAFKITFVVPALWFFGLFAALLGSGGEIELLYQSFSFGENQGALGNFIAGLSEGGFFSPELLGNLTKTMFTQPLTFLITLFFYSLVLALVVLVFWLVVVCQVALINSAVAVIKNKKWEWAASFRSGVVDFWPVFFVNALLKIISWSALSLLFFISSFNNRGLAPLFILTFIVFTSLIIVLSLITRYVILFIVLRAKKVGEALNLAIKLFTRNWLLSLEVAFTLFIIYRLINFGFIGTLAESIAYVLFQHPNFLAQFIFFGFLVFVFTQMLLAVFQWTSWTIVFEILENKNLSMASRILEFLKKVFATPKK